MDHILKAPRKPFVNRYGGCRVQVAVAAAPVAGAGDCRDTSRTASQPRLRSGPRDDGHIRGMCEQIDRARDFVLGTFFQVMLIVSSALLAKAVPQLHYNFPTELDLLGFW